jgi:GntR family transcriptional repressor for pyruvate dehydrogenase complex
MRPVYTPIRPKERLYQEIVEQIQQQIVSGQLKPGDQIPAERELADQFGVSRTAVREAIKSLTEKGLIEVFVGRGTFVTHFSPDRLVESMTLLLRNERDRMESLTEAQAVLDVPIARLAARHRTPDIIDRLRVIVDRMERDAGAPEQLVEADEEFRAELARATGNPVLAVLSRTLTMLLHNEHVRGAERPADMEPLIGAYRRLLDAVENGDEQRASDVMNELVSDTPRVRGSDRGGDLVASGGRAD